jgi:TonB family protein
MRAAAAFLLASVVMTGCSQFWMLPPRPDGSYRQSIAVDEPVPAAVHDTHFPNRKDLFMGKPDSPVQVRIRRMPNIPTRLGPVHAKLEIWAVVEVDGTVSDVAVAKSSGKPEVDDLYAKAVRTWSFSPAQVNGRAVAYEVGQAFVLQLD